MLPSRSTALGQLFFFGISGWISISLAGGTHFLFRPLGIAFVVLWAAWWGSLALGRDRGIQSDHERSQRWLRLLGGAALAAFVIGAPWEYRHFEGPLPRDGVLAWGGALVFGSGIALQVSALLALRSMYTVRLGIQASHRLVTEGPYRWLRHPGYLSNVMCLLGCALLWSSLGALVATGGVLLLLVWRIRSEEAMLLQAFGSAYRTYQQRTWRLVPWLY